MSGGSSLRSQLQGCVEQVLGEQVLDWGSVQQCLELFEECDVADEQDVSFALSQLLELAGHLWDIGGPEWGQQPIATAMSVALQAYATTGEPRGVVALASRLVEHGVHDLALMLYDEAVALDVTPVAEVRPPSIAQLQNNRGHLLRELGELDAAEIALRASLEAIDQTADTDQELFSVVLNNLALVELARGDCESARDTLIDALRVMERIDTGSLETAITLDNLARAEINLAEESGPLWLNEDYVNAPTAEHLRNAEYYLKDAQRLLVDVLPDSAEHYVISLLNSADVASQWREHKRVAAIALEAAELVEDGHVSGTIAYIVRSLEGRVFLDEGRPKEAAALLRPVFENAAATAPPHEIPSRLLTTLLSAATRVSDADLAKRVGRLLAQVDEEIFRRHLSAAAEQDALHLFQDFSDRAELVVGHILALASDDTSPRWVYEIVLNRKGVLAERQGSAWLRARTANTAFKDLLEQVRGLRSEVSRIDLDGSRSGAIQTARHAYSEAMERLAQAERQLYRTLEAIETEPPRIGVNKLQASLDAETVLLDFAVSQAPNGERHYMMFLVRPQGAIRFRDLGPVTTVNERLEALLDVLAHPSVDDRDQRRKTAELSHVAPELFSADDVLPSRVLMSPTGMWGMVPFGMMPDPTGVPLLEHHTIQLVPSARWLLTQSPWRAATAAPQVLGDPDFDLGFGEEVPFFLRMRPPRLIHAAQEVREVARLLHVEPVMDAEVTRGRLLSLVRPRILHIATHGVFIDAIASTAEASEPQATVMRKVGDTVVVESQDLSESPLGVGSLTPATEVHHQRTEWIQTIGPSGLLSRSTLLLAGFNRWLAGLDAAPEVGTGMISAGEFALLDLAGTELVVLSACQTGVGAVSYADGTLLGLRTAALAAGARWCVSSLWNVDDEQTSVLMSSFYREITGGRATADALRIAQLELRQRHSDPYFWAGWVAEGAEASSSGALDHAQRDHHPRDRQFPGRAGRLPRPRA